MTNQVRRLLKLKSLQIDQGFAHLHSFHDLVLVLPVYFVHYAEIVNVFHIVVQHHKRTFDIILPNDPQFFQHGCLFLGLQHVFIPIFFVNFLIFLNISFGQCTPLPSFFAILPILMIALIDETAPELRNYRFTLLGLLLREGLRLIEYLVVEQQIELTVRIVGDVTVRLGQTALHEHVFHRFVVIRSIITTIPHNFLLFFVPIAHDSNRLFNLADNVAYALMREGPAHLFLYLLQQIFELILNGVLLGLIVVKRAKIGQIIEIPPTQFQLQQLLSQPQLDLHHIVVSGRNDLLAQLYLIENTTQMNLRMRSNVVTLRHRQFAPKHRFLLIELRLTFGTKVALIEKERFNIPLTVMLMPVQELITLIFGNYRPLVDVQVFNRPLLQLLDLPQLLPERSLPSKV